MKVISCSWTGIAATLLIEGRTVHQTFSIPLDLKEDSIAQLKLGEPKAELVRNANLIIWDEAPMAPNLAFNAIDRFLKKQMENNLPFGGKNFFLGGDFRQTAPVVNHGKLHKNWRTMEIL
jgi:hypothetical protein